MVHFLERILDMNKIKNLIKYFIFIILVLPIIIFLYLFKLRIGFLGTDKIGDITTISNNFYLDDIQIGEYGSLMIPENTANSKLSIFRNPITKGNTTIVLDNIADKDVEISLINILGAEVGKLFSGIVVSKHQEILADVTRFKKGIYFVKVVSNGNVIMTDKLIIE